MRLDRGVHGVERLKALVFLANGEFYTFSTATLRSILDPTVRFFCIGGANLGYTLARRRLEVVWIDCLRYHLSDYVIISCFTPRNCVKFSNIVICR